MKQLGIDIGTSSLKLVLIENGKVKKTLRKCHHGKLISTLSESIDKMSLHEPTYICATGANAEVLLGKHGALPRLDDIPAIVEGIRYLVPEAGSIIDIGGQRTRFITNIQTGIPNFNVNEHCAGGTGSFFEDQMSRLGLKIEDYSGLVQQAGSIPRLSGRCAVFAKTDIIHRQQEGVSTPDILLGLCYAMIRNYKAVIVKSLPVCKPVVFTGGVTLNEGAVRAVREVFALEDEQLIVPENALFAGAIGAALKADTEMAPEELKKLLQAASSQMMPVSLLPRLILTKGTVLCDPEMTETIPPDGVSLGIDIGSTSTDLVLVDRHGVLVDFQYLRTAGNPELAVRKGLEQIRRKYGEIPFISVGVTGSGRERIGRMIGADAVRDEITAQAKAAAFWVPGADTVFEIGGQDSKYISLRDGQVADFQMNKICAAGTGSFVEEQAARMDVPIGEFGALALSSEHPSDLGERCTVFIETAIDSAQAAGAGQDDIAAGLCHSIVKNYLHKVVGSKPVGKHIVLQGGVAYNPGIVAAFQESYRDSITVSPCFSVSGAFGVACLALEAAGTRKSTFKGYDFPGTEQTGTIYSEEVSQNIAFYRRTRKNFFKGYDPVPDPGKKTVGIPYVLMMHKFFPLANAFFRQLGFNVLLSDPTNEDTIRIAQQAAEGETCYPVKLIYGHILQLAEKKVDYIFLPAVRTIRHVKSHVAANYGCVYMQSAGVSIAKILKLEEKGIHLLSPTFDLDFGKEALVTAMLETGKQLGKHKPVCLPALMAGAAAVRQYDAAAEKLGKDLMNSLAPDDKVLVMITRNYGIQDPVLNMGIPELLLERGYKVINLEHLPAHDLSLKDDYPNLYWPFGQHILSGARLIKHHPNLYAVYLTNHGCGPDTMLSHMFREEMGEKPYLQIEVDEHFSKVGVITRVEAFLNSLSNRKSSALPAEFDMMAVENHAGRMFANPDQFTRDRILYVPDMGEYTSFICSYLEDEYGITAKVLSKPCRTQLLLGRAETVTKEYLPFTALLGSILDQLLKLDREECKKTDFLIPTTEGAEADGQYCRAIRAVLDRKGYQDTGIFSPLLEQIPSAFRNPEKLVRGIIAGDLLYLVPHTDRRLSKMQALPTEEEIIRFAREMPACKPAALCIGVVGTPLTLTVLNEGVLDSLESEDKKVFRAPLSEALWFMWTEETTIRSECHEFLIWLKSLLKNMGNNTGAAFAFDPDPEALHTSADLYVKGIQGGNLRYRFAKAVSLGEHMDAVFSLAPRYENAAMVMDMRGLKEAVNAPLMEINFDGDWEESAWERVRSFLYYCQRKQI